MNKNGATNAAHTNPTRQRGSDTNPTRQRGSDTNPTRQRGSEPSPSLTRRVGNYPLGEIAEITMGQSPPGSTYNRDGQGVPLLNGPAEFGECHPIPVQWTTEPSRFARKGDILFCVRGATTGRKCWSDQEYAIGRGLAAMRGRPGTCNTQYLWFLLDVVIDSLLKRAAGSTFVNLPGEEILKFRVFLPPLAEQERIAARLTEQLAAVERSRAAAQARLAAAEALPAAYLREVFEGPEASEWNVVPVYEIAEVCGGVQKQPSRSPDKFHRPYLTVRNVQRGSLDLSHVERFEITRSELDRLRLRHGDILIVEGNGSPDQIGRNAVFDLDGQEWIHQNHIIRIRLGERANYHYVSRYLNSDAGRTQMLERARSTSGLYTLSVEKVKNLEIPLPSLSEQRRIAAALSLRVAEAERLTAVLREELVAIDALPAALLREAFNGYIDPQGG